MPRTKNFADLIKAKLAANPALAEAVEQEVIHAHIAQQVQDLRTAAGLTQKQLAEQIGTQQSVISRIENADYDGHSLGLLKRIADALGKKVTITFSDKESVQRTSVQTTEAVSSGALHQDRLAGRWVSRVANSAQVGMISLSEQIQERG